MGAGTYRGTVISTAEMAAGLILNVWLGLGIWDYSSLPDNLWGQICQQFWALWCLLSAPVILLFDWVLVGRRDKTYVQAKIKKLPAGTRRRAAERSLERIENENRDEEVT